MAGQQVVQGGLTRTPMSFEEWLELPEKPKSEWVDGIAAVSTVSPTYDHGFAQAALSATLRAALPGLRVVSEVPVRTAVTRVRLPDVMALERRPVGAIVEDTPVLAVEILSPSTRSEDTVRKSAEYAAAGIGQFWIVDPELRTLEVFANRDGRWETVLVLDEASRTGAVTVGEHGSVGLDLAQILDLDG